MGECKILNSILQPFHFLFGYRMLSKGPADPGRAALGVERLKNEDKTTGVSVGGLVRAELNPFQDKVVGDFKTGEGLRMRWEP